MIFWNLFHCSFERGRFISDGYNITTLPFLCQQVFSCFFDIGLSWCVIMVGMAQRFPRFPDSGFPLFRFPYTVCLTTYEKDFSLRSK